MKTPNAGEDAEKWMDPSYIPDRTINQYSILENSLAVLKKQKQKRNLACNYHTTQKIHSKALIPEKRKHVNKTCM